MACQCCSAFAALTPDLDCASPCIASASPGFVGVGTDGSVWIYQGGGVCTLSNWKQITSCCGSITDNGDGTYTFDDGQGNTSIIDVNQAAATAATVTFAPIVGCLVATNVQAAITELAAKARPYQIIGQAADATNCDVVTNVDNIFHVGNTVIGATAGSNTAKFTVAGSTSLGANDHGIVGTNATIGGGSNNTASGISSFVGGGSGNTVGGENSTISGRDNSITSSQNSAVVGGTNNTITSTFGTNGLFSGYQNTISGTATVAVIVGGHGNVIGGASGESSIIINGNSNTINTAATVTHSAVLNGSANSITVTGGGFDNTIIGSGTSVITGNGTARSAILAGDGGTIDGGVFYAVLLGGINNSITAGNANAILGGNNNTITAGNNNAVIGSATSSIINTGSSNAVIAGNSFTMNTSGAYNAAIASAGSFTGFNSFGFINGGAGLINASFAGSILSSDGSGGANPTLDNADYSSIIASLGGNIITNSFSSMIMGSDGVASTITNGNGSFIWGSNSATAHTDNYSINLSGGLSALASTANGQFQVVAPGGIIFYSNVAQNRGRRMNPNTNSWAAISDRRTKYDITPVDLDKLYQNFRQIDVFTYKTKEAYDYNLTQEDNDAIAALQAQMRDRDNPPTDVDAILQQILDIYDNAKTLSQDVSVGIMANDLNERYDYLFTTEKIDQYEAYSELTTVNVLWGVIQHISDMVEALPGGTNDFENRISILETETAGVQLLISKVETTHNEDVKTLKSDINKLSNKHNVDIEKLSKKHNSDFSALKNKHNTELNALRKTHNQSISKLKKELKETNDRLDELEKLIREMPAQHRSKYD